MAHEVPNDEDSQPGVKRVSAMDASSAEVGVSLPPELLLVPHGDGSARVCTRVAIPSHRKFGPYQAKTRKDPSVESISWKVSLIFSQSVAGAKSRCQGKAIF